MNRLTSIASDNSTLPEAVFFAYAYNTANQRTGVTNADASYWQYGYDRLGQVTNGWRYWGGGSNVLGQTFNYSFDDIGNRTSTQTGGDDTGASLRTATYSANLLNQYTNRTVPGYLEVNGTATNSAEVRVNGSVASRQGDYFRREVTVNNSSSALAQWLTSVATNANGTTTVVRLSYVSQTPEAFTHDEDGNLTSDGLWDYTWDGENRLTRIELQTNTITDSVYWQRVECDYDYLSRRLRKRAYGWDTNANAFALTRSIRYFYYGWNLVGQVDEVTGIRLSFLWGMDLSGTLQGAGGVGGLLAMVVHNGSEAGTYFYGYDGNGNVAVLVNAEDGSEAARYEYGPFGELVRATGPVADLNPFRFSTKYQDEETGLIYYGYRYYAANTGRWLSKDPMQEGGGVNLYANVLNNPLGWVDRDGRDSYAIDPMAPTTVNNRVALVSIQAFENRSTGDNSSGYALGWSWLSGKSGEFRSFSGQDRIAEQMSHTPEAEDARKRLREILSANGGCTTGVSVRVYRNLGSEPKGEFYAGFTQDVLGRNPSRAFMGSFDGSATVTDCWACCAVVKFDINNRVGWQSGTRLPPPYGYDPNRIALFENWWTPAVFGASWAADLSRWEFNTNHVPRSILPDNAFGRYGQTINVQITWEEFICPTDGPLSASPQY